VTRKSQRQNIAPDCRLKVKSGFAVSLKKLAPGFSLIALALLAFGAYGCFSQPYLAINSFDVTPPEPNLRSNQEVRPYVVLVSQFAVAAAYETRKLVYKSRDEILLEDYYNELVASPGRLLADSLSTYLDIASPSAQFVRSQGQRGADFVLEGYLAEFYGDFSQSPPVAKIYLTLTLNDVRGERAKIVLAKAYRAQVPFQPKNATRPAGELVKALTAAFAEVLAELEKDLASGQAFRKKT
jgi:ABC-type uncharacterized transport system auxiliary subunit